MHCVKPTGRVGRDPTYLGMIIVLFSTLWVSAGALAQPVEMTSACDDRACLVIEYDDELSEETKRLMEILTLRLCKKGVRVVLQSPSDSERGQLPKDSPTNNPCANAREDTLGTLWWVTHLRAISPSKILVAVDHLGADSDDDLIKEVQRTEDTDATVWTLVLIIEGAVSPYLESSSELEPVGVGLAIIEPPQVGGVKKSSESKSVRYPDIRCVSLLLAMYYAGATSDTVDNILFGPSLGIQGLLGPRFVAMFNVSWVGTARFDYNNGDIKGGVSYVPIELLFGYVFLQNKHVDLSFLSGFSIGFSIIQTSSSSLQVQRTDLYFDPWVKTRLDATIFAYGPLAIYVNLGVVFPIIKDVLKNGEVEVYRQDWIMPEMGIGLQLWI